MYACFYDNNFSKIDEIELEGVHSFTRDMIEHAGGRLNKVSSLFIICSEEERGDVTVESLLAFYAPLVKKELSLQCEQYIKEGFYSDSLQANFTYNEQDQSNLANQLSLINIGTAIEPIKCPSVDKGVLELTTDQFKQLFIESEVHKQTYREKYWSIKEKLFSCTSLEALKQIDDFHTAEDILDSYSTGS